MIIEDQDYRVVRYEWVQARHDNYEQVVRNHNGDAGFVDIALWLNNARSVWDIKLNQRVKVPVHVEYRT